jgi:tetratricopeptide (TPR) repeat protein
MAVSELEQALQTYAIRAAQWQACSRYDEAEYELTVAVHVAEREAGPASVELAGAAADLGVLLEALGRPDDAEEPLRRSVRIYELVCGPDHPRLAVPLSALGAVCRLRGDLGAAERFYRRALSLGDIGSSDFSRRRGTP